MHNPRIVHAEVEWTEVAAQLEALAGPATGSIARLNQATEQLFANIAASPVPVLLPFNTAQLLRDGSAGATNAAVGYLIDVRPPPFFQAGPGGYDAVFSVRAKDMPGSDAHFSDRIDVHISGSALLYDLDEPAGMIGWPVNNGLGADFPGIKRLYLDSSVRYTFVRFGVPYAVSIECHDGRARFRKISCRDADKVATRILKTLQVAGGTPQPQPALIEANTIERPQSVSPVFTYHAPGDILPGSGMKGRPGRADYTVYSKMRFPLAQAPAFANSQSFMNWGDCDQTGRVSIGRLGDTAVYRCRVNSLPLIADESANYSYPWRDNFCEHRYFFVGECPGGLGHQGQDIRPSSCTQRVPGANRCEPYQHDVVAVRDGIVLRAPGQFALLIVTNTASERVSFRYLHMFPKHLDQDGIVSGRAVSEGEVIGKVGNYNRRERATTYHLHFDMQVPTKYGWVYVNPYMSLVAAYERQIGGRGRQLRPDGTPIAIGSAALPAPTSQLDATPAANPVTALPASTSTPDATPAANPVTALPASTSTPDATPAANPVTALPASTSTPNTTPAVNPVTVLPASTSTPDATPAANPVTALPASTSTPNTSPAANPVKIDKIDIKLKMSSGIGSDTAANERMRSKQP